MRNQETAKVVAYNPIIPGFYPDPSICAAGEDFYLIHSSFAYFPGLPVMHSRDLAHWEQVGNVMDRHTQLPLDGCGHSQGLFAPTIRFYKGVYYVICTNVSYGGNFIVTAQNPTGPWSEPHYIQGAQGIDPSLFFDEDGTCYYIGTRQNPKGCRYDGDWYIWIQELDIEHMRLVGEPRDVWNGAMRDIIWPEGPHLYKKDGYYYILHAEGGTGPYHAVTVCRSREVFGPYENNFRNPILTHRHLGKTYPIQYVGHGDFVETSAGEWYMVMLAVRPLDGYTTMGRETFLAKVDWEDGWPVVNPGSGVLTDEVRVWLKEWNPLTDPKSYTNRREAEGLPRNAFPGSSRVYDFKKQTGLGDEFLFLRSCPQGMYRLEPGQGLCLKGQKVTLKEQGSPSYIGIRQQHHRFRIQAALGTESLGGDIRSGIALVQSNEYHLRVEADRSGAVVYLCEKGQDYCISRTDCSGYLNGSEFVLSILVEGLKASVYVGMGEEQSLLAEGIDIHSLSTEVAGGFVGCTAGMYAVSDEDGPGVGEAVFLWFSYEAV